MERVSLYYPAINFPNNTWLRTALLYSDKISTIVPHESYSDASINVETQKIIDAGLYHPIYAFDAINSNAKEYRILEKNFLSVIDGKEFQNIKKKYIKEKYYTSGINDYKLFTSKFSHKIADKLENLGLINDRNSDEAYIEKTCAFIYMSMLSDFAARVDNNLITVSTDNHEFEKLAFQFFQPTGYTQRLMIENCLPVPNSNVKIEKIIAFKQKRRAELANFRAQLDSLQKELCECSSIEQQKLKLIQFKERIEKDVLEIKKMVGDSFKETILKSLSSLLEGTQPALFGTLASAGLMTAGSIINQPNTLVAGGLLLVGTTISSFKRISRNAESHSSSFLFYLQRDGFSKFK